MTNSNREAFEKFATEHGMNVLRVGEAYSDDDINYSWWIWQHAISSQLQGEAVAVVESCKSVMPGHYDIAINALCMLERGTKLYTGSNIAELSKQLADEKARLDWALDLLFNEEQTRLYTSAGCGCCRLDEDFEKGTTGRQAIDIVRLRNAN